MMHYAKQFAKCLPHPLLMRLYHTWYMRQQHVVLRQVSGRLGTGRLLQNLDLSLLKRTDTVFILGSGPSINKISRDRWDTISRCDTIGFNWWPLHTFVPNIYVYESLDSTSPLYSCFLQMFRQRAHAYRSCVKIVTDLRAPETLEQLVYSGPDEFGKDAYLGLTVPVVARNIDELHRGLDFICSRGGFQKTTRTEWLFKYGGSVTAMISLALQIGYTRVVLCGVDLGPQEYFYQDRNLYPHSADWEFVPRSQPHLTTRELPYMVPAQKVLWAMDDEILRPAGVQLFVESATSTLYPLVPAVSDQELAGFH